MNSKLRMVALYDCVADDAEELSFKEGDVFINVTQSSDKDWYEGTIEHTDRRGLFPGNFVKSLPGSLLLEKECQKAPVRLTGLSVGELARNLTEQTPLQRKPSLPSSLNKPVYTKKAGLKERPKPSDPLPTRARSYSASFIKSLRPAPLVGPAEPKPETDEEDEDGFQLIKPSQIRRQNRSTELPARENPMPRLPSRPVSAATRKSRLSKPELLPKPQPVLPPRPTKLRSVSNPPPLQPKPAPLRLKSPLPQLPAKPALSPVRARSATNPVSFDKKKVAPPPPPSRPPQDHARARYERLFLAIHDQGYVDSLTVQTVWNKSKLSQEKLAKIWIESVPDSQGLLDKQGFIHGMGKIDFLLKKYQSSAS